MKVERGRRRFPTPSFDRNIVLVRGCIPLAGTGVLAGGAVQLGFLLGPTVDGHGGEVGAVIALLGLSGCTAILAWCWSRLSAPRIAIGAAASTAVLSFLTTALFVFLAAAPYDAIVCDNSSDFCGLGVVQVVSTLGAVVPWTVAGIPGLVVVGRDYRRNSLSEN